MNFQDFPVQFIDYAITTEIGQIKSRAIVNIDSVKLYVFQQFIAKKINGEKAYVHPDAPFVKILLLLNLIPCLL